VQHPDHGHAAAAQLRRKPIDRRDDGARTGDLDRRAGRDECILHVDHDERRALRIQPS